jgi:hypothetical protein
MKLFRATRIYTSREEVEVFANHADEAREKFEDDDSDVVLITTTQDDYEVSPGSLYEVNE